MSSAKPPESLPTCLRFISLEGSEACGKSTQIKHLRHRLEQQGHTVVTTREPGGTPLGEALRHLLQQAPEGEAMEETCELFLFAASRSQLSRQVIAPALASGAWVISDRYADSTWVYQGWARGLPFAEVEATNRLAVGSCLPQLTLVLDLPLEETQRRLHARQSIPYDRIERLPIAFFERVQEGYRHLAQLEPERVQLINASGTEEEVHDKIWRKVHDAFFL